MPDFRALLSRLSEGLKGHGLPFMVIGGQAVLLHGEPRLTQDVDITLGIGPTRLHEVLVVCEELGLEALPEEFSQVEGREGLSGVLEELRREVGEE